MHALTAVVMFGCGKDDGITDPDPKVSIVILPPLTVNPCDKVEYPILGANMANIYGIELYINYEEDQATFDSLTSSYFDLKTGVSDGVIQITWVDMNLHPITIKDENTILTLYFSDLAGTCEFSFSSLSEIYDAKGDPIDIHDKDGNLINIEDLNGSVTCNNGE